MGKPTIYVAINNTYDMRTISNKLDKKFDIRYWPYTRNVTHEEMKANVEGVFGIICGPFSCYIDSEIIDAAGSPTVNHGENLKVVGTVTAGYNHLDVKTLKARGVRIGYLGSLNAMNITVAEYAIGLLLSTARCIVNDHQALRKNVDYLDRTLFDCAHHYTVWDSVVGIIGCGNIGIEIIKRLQAFSPKQFLYSSRKPKSEVNAMGGEWKSVDEICKNSDFIIVTADLNKDTHHLVNQTRLDSMKPNAIIVNVARGGIIDEKALCQVLQNKKIAGAGLDVQEEEPIQPNNPLMHLDNVVITPHMAGSTAVVWNEQLDRVIENILAVYENREMPSEL